MLKTDTERLNWLETKEGWGLINDDFGRWALTGTGIPKHPRTQKLPPTFRRRSG